MPTTWSTLSSGISILAGSVGGGLVGSIGSAVGVDSTAVGEVVAPNAVTSVIAVGVAGVSMDALPSMQALVNNVIVIIRLHRAT